MEELRQYCVSVGAIQEIKYFGSDVWASGTFFALRSTVAK